MSGPLDGVRILDLTTVVMGPYATQILADFGADVVKLEPPEGDIVRLNGPAKNPGMGHIFLNTNRNKRSIALDLKHAAAKPVIERLARWADVVIESNQVHHSDIGVELASEHANGTADRVTQPA